MLNFEPIILCLFLILILGSAEERIKQMKNQALKDIKNTSVKIAIESVEKLLKNSMDK